MKLFIDPKFEKIKEYKMYDAATFYEYLLMRHLHDEGVNYEK